jgi:hypothetical protein
MFATSSTTLRDRDIERRFRVYKEALGFRPGHSMGEMLPHV